MNDKCKNCQRLIIAEAHTTCKKCGKPLHKDCAIKTKQGEYCDVCFETKNDISSQHKLPEVIRRSNLDEYEDCPYSAYLNIIKNVETPGNSFAEIGIAIHSCFERYFVELHKPNRLDLIRWFDELYSQIKDESFEAGVQLYKEKTVEQHKEEMYNVGLACIDNFLKLEDEQSMQANRRIISLERTIQFSVGDNYPLIQTTIDRIEEIDGEIEIIDYKSGSVMVGKDLQDNLQVPLYIIAVEKELNRKVKRFTLLYLRDGSTRVYERVDENTFRCTVKNQWYNVNLPRTIERVKMSLDKMQKGEWDVPTEFKKMYFKCKTCNKKRYGYCDGAESQVWKNKTEFSW